MPPRPSESPGYQFCTVDYDLGVVERDQLHHRRMEPVLVAFSITLILTVTSTCFFDSGHSVGLSAHYEVGHRPLLIHQHSPSPLNPLGVKGVGEGGAISPPVAIANAVCDALRPLQVEAQHAAAQARADQRGDCGSVSWVLRRRFVARCNELHHAIDDAS